MAVIGNKEKLSLKLELDAGLVDGKQRVKTKTFTKIKTGAADEGLYQAGLVLGSLQTRDLLKVRKVEETELFDE